MQTALAPGWNTLTLALPKKMSGVRGLGLQINNPNAWGGPAVHGRGHDRPIRGLGNGDPLSHRESGALAAPETAADQALVKACCGSLAMEHVT
jgi:hypothetical protein